MFGVAVVIGAGIFTLTVLTVLTAGDYAGPSVSVAFVLAAVTCGLAALCCAEFAPTVPVAGSAYTFSRATFGDGVKTTFNLGGITVDWGAFVLVVVLMTLLAIGTKLSSRFPWSSPRSRS